MLRRFLYLNEASVDSYIGVVERGLSDETTRRRGQKGVKGGEGGIDINLISAKGGGQHENTQDDESVVRDTPEHRFDRLMRAVEADPEIWNYEEVLDFAEAFGRLPTGTLISVDCEIEVPPTIALLSQPDELNQLLDLMENIGPIASAFGATIEGMPSGDQINAARAFTRFKADVVVVGEVDEETPRIAGKLDQKYVREMPEGEARVVGKVARRWQEGQRYPLIALPGATLLTRSRRRQATPPADSSDENVLHGPALTLDILAIFR